MLTGEHVRGSLDNRGAAHVAHVVRGRERRGAVHGAAVVPDHQVADLPFVAVDELRLRFELDQLGVQRLPLLDQHAGGDPAREYFADGVTGGHHYGIVALPRTSGYHRSASRAVSTRGLPWRQVARAIQEGGRDRKRSFRERPYRDTLPPP